MVIQSLINITIANNFQEKWQQYNITAETLMQLSVSIWDLMLAFFYQVFIFYNQIQQKWTQLNDQYKLVDTAFALFTQSLSVLENVSGYLVRAFNNSDWIIAVAENIILHILDFIKDLLNQIPSPHEMQQNWTQINDQYKLTETASALLTQSQSAVENISGYLVRAFNNSDWIFAVASNLMVVIVDFVKDLPNQIPSPQEMQQKWSQINEQYRVTDTVVALFTQFLSALESIYVYLTRAYNNSDWIFVVARNQMVALTETTIDILRKLKTLLPPEKRGDQIPDRLYLGVYFVILVVLVIVCIRNLGPRGKMMKAPGKPNMVISRAAFEDNPRKYFAGHRRKR